ncbi:MAG: uracil-DNA glycosylase [Pyrinomonadaceae bacterium]
MSQESSTPELLSLLEQTRERLVYLQELGVTGLTPEPVTRAQFAQTVPLSSETRQTVVSSVEAISPSTPLKSKPHQNQETKGTQAKSVTSATAGLPLDTLFGDLAPPPDTLVKSAESLEDIWADVGDCTRCPLYQGRTNIVHTEGSRKARLMFVGEAPGADEDAQARPFVGRAGQLLTRIIESLGLQREEVLIGNVNRCRPPGNRPPTPDEAAICKPFLLREIAAVAPEVIVVLGNTAMRNLLEVKEGITKVRGRFQDYKGIKVMPTFHPAFLLRDPAKKRETWEDLKKVRDYLDRK